MLFHEVTLDAGVFVDLQVSVGVSFVVDGGYKNMPDVCFCLLQSLRFAMGGWIVCLASSELCIAKSRLIYTLGCSYKKS